MKLKTTCLFSKPNFLWFLLFFTSLSWGQTAVNLPLTRTTWSGATPAGWIDSAGGAYTTSFACSGSNGARFDTTGDSYVVRFSDSPDKLSFVIKANSTNTSTRLLIEESTNGSNYTTVVELTGSNGASGIPTTCATKGPYQLNTESRYVRWRFTKGNTNSTMDDVSITKNSLPTLNVTPEQLTDLNYVQGNGPSVSQTIAISGSDLSGNLTISSNSANFEVSEDNLTYYPFPYTFTNYTGTSKTIYVHLKSLLNAGDYNGDISVSSNSITEPIIIPVSGTVSLPNSVPVITSTSFSGMFGVPFSEQIIASNSPTTYDYTGENLPSGLVLNSITGVINGTPTVAGNFSGTFVATNQYGTSSPQSINFIISKANQTVNLSNLIKTSLDSPIALPELTNEENALSYTSSNTNVATIQSNSGISTIVYQGIGEATITATALETDTHNSFSSTFTINFVQAPEITSKTINGYVGNAINEQLIFTPTGSVTTLANGSTLPAGLSLNNSGLISGTPTEAGSFTVQVIASNNNLDSEPAIISFTILNTFSGENCLTETFSSVANGNNTSNSGSGSSFNGNSFFPVANNAYQAGGAIRLGTGSNTGYIESNNLPSISGSVVVTVDVKGWAANERTLKVTLGNQSQDIDYTAIMADAFETKTVVFENVPANSKLRISTTNKRAFVGNVEICNNATNKNVCVNSTLADLNATFEDSENVSWFASETSNTALAESFELINGIYYMQIGEQVTRTPFNVTLNPVPQAPVMADEIFCGSTFVSNLPQGDAFASYKWYANNEGGNALNSTESISTGTYYVSQTINGCESIERTEVLITVNQIPNAPIVANQTFCGTTIVDALPQGEGTYKWYTNATDETSLALSANLTSGTYFVSTTANNCESERTEVTITINEIPDTPDFDDQVFCGTTTVNALPQGDSFAANKWYANTTDETSLALNTNLTSGTYFVSTTINGCESERTEVTVTINEIPDAPVVDDQTFCGTTIVDALPQSQGTYKWYANATDETNLALSENLTSGTYFVSTTANGCESERTEVTITINEIPDTPDFDDQVFCGTATVNDLPQGDSFAASKWYANATDETSLDLNTNLTSGTYFVSTTINGCESERAEVTVTINEVPDAPIVDDQTFCGATIVDALPQGEGAYKWYANATDETSLALSTNLTSGTYFVSTTINGCESERTEVNLTINEIPTAPIVDDQTFCGATIVDALPQGQGTYKWYVNATDETNLALSENLTSGTYFVSTTANGCESERNEVTITINEIPDTPDFDDQVFCGTATVNDLPQGDSFAANKWYANATDETSLALSTNLTSGTYFVSTTINGCESERAEVTITINEIPDAPIVDDQVFCGTTTVNALPQGDSFATNKWYANATDETSLDLNTNLTSGTYFVSTTINGCESERAEVTVTINEIPTAPIVDDQTFCGATIVDALPQGQGTYKWYANATDETNLALSENLTSGTYFVSTTANGCESERNEVTITINEIPTAPNVSAQSFCGSAIVDALPQGNETYKWYSNATEGSSLALNTNLSTGNYYVSRIINGCESIERKLVIVTINEVPNAPSVSAQTFCQSATVGALPQGNGTYKWFTAANGGTSLNLSASISTGTYYVSTTSNNCESSRTAVSVTIINIPNVNASSIQTFCGSATISNLTATGVEGSEILWYNSLNQENPLSDSTPLVNGTYYVAQKVNDCTSPRKAVSVQITTTSAPTVNSFSFCGSATVADLTIIAQSGVTHKWYTSPTNSNSLTLNTSLNSGVYYVSRVQNGCESARAAVQVTIESLPNSPTGNETQTFVEGSTINHLIVQPASAVWYSTIDDAKTGTNQLSPGMPLVQGETYYAVNIGTNGCPSLPLAVTVNLTLDNEDFIKKGLKLYPNPVSDYLTIEYSEAIDQIVIYNILGQSLYSKKYNESVIQVDFNNFDSGTYMIKVFTKRGEAFLKIIKQ